ncbi:hypothetical protein D9619_004824 [Psilocybe cf. subviscida]|uniref:WLM domain-containing protein n=1 Tax=Psilocybe cf. subviscida TaxID=2480587 RepID=A0A8H5BQ66_9AGAR|nr:hypothetical protein D9619_004824 [Psilocybe cf. subviscida]
MLQLQHLAPGMESQTPSTNEPTGQKKLNRTPKPVPLWNTYDLKAFNIEIIDERDIQTFFGVTDLPVPQNISPVIWNNVSAPPEPLSKTEKIFFAYMEDALLTPPGELSLVDDFALFLLELFDYDDGPHRILQPQEDLWLPICGSRVLAKTDGAVIDCVGHQPYYVLLVQEDTQLYDNGGLNPEAQLVAQAIAAFHRNNRVRDLIGLPALDSQTFPAIIMFCTAPVFYFVTVTKVLADAVQAGVYPSEATIVRKFFSPVGLTAKSMFSLENRWVLFGYFEAFRRFLSPAIGKLSAQNKKSTMSSEPTKGPYNLIAFKASDPCFDCDTLADVGNLDKTRNQWSDNIATGTRVEFELVNNNKHEAWSNVITLGESGDDSCLSFSGAASASASASAYATSPSSSATAMIEAGRTYSTTSGSTAGPETLWTTRDLQAFNIKIIVEHDIQTFFRVSDLPVPQGIPHVIWNNARAPAGPLSKTERLFFAYIENALLAPLGKASHAVKFVRFLLGLLDYDADPNRVLHSGKDIWFVNAGVETYAMTDVAVIERVGGQLYYNLLVQCHDHTAGCDPEAQLVAQAIAAFHRNNDVLHQVYWPRLDSQTFPGIIMAGTTPTFYLITVTDALSAAVEAGICPQETTIVRKFVPPVELADHTGDGMVSLQNRKSNTMVHLRLNETETNPNPHINFITALPDDLLGEQEEARQLLRALAAQVRPVMKVHGFVVNSFEEVRSLLWEWLRKTLIRRVYQQYEYNNVFAGRNWNNGETDRSSQPKCRASELVLRRADGAFYPIYWLMGTLCHEHMNHGPDFQKLWSLLKAEVRQLQDKGYYGDGYWSSGTRLRDSARVGGEGIEDGDFPEYMCGGAQTKARPTARRRRQGGSRGKRREVQPSLHTGAQTAKKRKSGARVTSKYAFTGEGATLVAEGSAIGTGFGKKAASKRARDERALAAEKRLQALLGPKTDAKPAPQQTPNEGANASDGDDDSDDEVEFVPETDAERRQALLDSEHEYKQEGSRNNGSSSKGKELQSKLGSGAAWKSMQDDFNFSAVSNSGSGASTSQTGAKDASNRSKGKTKSKARVDSDVIEISSSDGDEEEGEEQQNGDQDADESCDLPIASGSTFTTHPHTSQSKSSSRTPAGLGLGLGKMVQTEMELRRKEALGMAPVKGGGRTLGAEPTKASTKTRKGSQVLAEGRTLGRPTQKKRDGVEGPEGRWACLGERSQPPRMCRMYNAPRTGYLFWLCWLSYSIRAPAS